MTKYDKAVDWIGWLYLSLLLFWFIFAFAFIFGTILHDVLVVIANEKR